MKLIFVACVVAVACGSCAGNGRLRSAAKTEDPSNSASSQMSSESAPVSASSTSEDMVDLIQHHVRHLESPLPYQLPSRAASNTPADSVLKPFTILLSDRHTHLPKLSKEESNSEMIINRNANKNKELLQPEYGSELSLHKKYSNVNTSAKPNKKENIFNLVKHLELVLEYRRRKNKEKINKKDDMGHGTPKVPAFVLKQKNKKPTIAQKALTTKNIKILADPKKTFEPEKHTSNIETVSNDEWISTAVEELQKELVFEVKPDRRPESAVIKEDPHKIDITEVAINRIIKQLREVLSEDDMENSSVTVDDLFVQKSNEDESFNKITSTQKSITTGRSVITNAQSLSISTSSNSLSTEESSTGLADGSNSTKVTHKPTTAVHSVTYNPDSSSDSQTSSQEYNNSISEAIKLPQRTSNISTSTIENKDLISILSYNHNLSLNAPESKDSKLINEFQKILDSTLENDTKSYEDIQFDEVNQVLGFTPRSFNKSEEIIPFIHRNFSTGSTRPPPMRAVNPNHINNSAKWKFEDTLTFENESSKGDDHTRGSKLFLDENFKKLHKETALSHDPNNLNNPSPNGLFVRGHETIGETVLDEKARELGYKSQLVVEVAKPDKAAKQNKKYHRIKHREHRDVKTYNLSFHFLK